MARPRKKIDPELVRKLAMIHCTNLEIAAVCDCDVKTVERRFAPEIAKGREQGKTTLRKGLWELASKGNLGALIWLSKNHLGMSDKIEAKNENLGLQYEPIKVTIRHRSDDEKIPGTNENNE